MNLSPSSPTQPAPSSPGQPAPSSPGQPPIWDVAIEVVEQPAGQDGIISIVLDDNFVDYTGIEVEGSVLRIGFNRGNIDPDITPTATVTLPSDLLLTATTSVSGNAEGASDVLVEGGAVLNVSSSGASDVRSN